MLLLQLALAAAPLLGWGVTDLRGFAANVVRLGVVLGAIISCGVIAWQPVPAKPFAQGIRAQARARSISLMLGILSVPIVLAGLAYMDRRDVLVMSDSTAIRWIGLLMYASGEGVRIAALRSLGRQYSAYVTVQRHHALIQTGMYRFVRHPIYLAQLMVVPGMALAFRSVLAVPLFFVSVLFVSKRIPHEEALLERTFAEFDEYRRATWRLVPFIY